MIMSKRSTILALAGAALGFSVPSWGQSPGKPKFQFMVRDEVFLHIAGKDRLARIYQPRGEGNFPTLVLVHGGGWDEKDRTDGPSVALALASAGILVVSLDYRLASEAKYPAALQDINYGVRWVKVHAHEFGGRGRVGIYGYSAGGHLAVLAALRPSDPRYGALALPQAPEVNSKVSYLISGWSVLFPLERLKRAEADHETGMIEKHKLFFGTPEVHLEATPALILEGGEVKEVPPALFFQGTRDRWTTVDEFQRVAADWRKVGGQADVLLLEGEKHSFLNDTPNAPNARTTLDAMIAFIKAHG